MPRKPKDLNASAQTPPNDGVPLPNINMTRRRNIGVFLLVWSVVLFLALISYDWHDIPWLCNPSNGVTGGLPNNKLGILGAWLTFYGYGIAGLAYHYFAIPLLILISCMMIYGKTRYFRLRVIWIILLYGTLACLFQTLYGDYGTIDLAHDALGGASGDKPSPLLLSLNILPNAGGAIGQWLISDLLRPLIGNVGLHLLLWTLTLLFTVLIIGVRNLICLFTLLMTSRTTHTLTPGEEALLARHNARKNADTSPQGAPDAASTSLATRLKKFFARPTSSPTASDEDTPSAIEVLKNRRAVSGNAWTQPKATPADTPLFGASQPKATVATPAPAPTKRADPFTLRSDDASPLKPVSPEIAVTAPVPTAHDNTEPEEVTPDYGLPPLHLLGEVPPKRNNAEDIQGAIAAIESTLETFRISAKVVNYKRGPVLTQFEVRPEENVDLKKFEGTRRNLLMNLRAESIRIQAPIPGRDLVGIEVPNTVRQSVTLREILEGDAWREAERTMELPLAMGKLATGGDLIVDLAEMPHLLVAGGTGSGKSVAVNDMLIGLLMCRKPDRLRLLMVDPKRVEFTSYDNLPHLLNPVVVEPKKVMFSLRWAKLEMERRYEQLQKYGVRNIGEFNNRVDNPLPHRDNPTARLPFIVLIIDELADLMNDPAVRAEIETPIAALTAKARAAGIHLIIATQRPTTDIITGTIKSNIPGRVALRVAQANDSRTILDESGAENLIGKGDMLLGRAGKPTLRSQAAWVTNEAIDAICDYIRDQAGPAFDKVLAGSMERIQEEKTTNTIQSILNDFLPQPKDEPPVVVPGSEDDTSTEGYYLKALELIRQTGRYSTSLLQRRHGIGYPKASRITDMLEQRGIIGPPTKAGGTREILVDLNAEERQKVAGTDGETAAFDTRTAGDAELPDTDTNTEPVAQTEPMDSAPEEDFDLGDFDPNSLGIPEITHAPQTQERE